MRLEDLKKEIPETPEFIHISYIYRKAGDL